MSSPPKSGDISQPDLTRAGLYKVAIVGAGSLKGKELAEVLNDRNFPSAQVKLLDDDEALGQLEAVGDEVTFIQKLRVDEFRNLDFTFFASDAECTLKSWKIARDAGSAIIDLSYALEDDADAIVRSPWIERQLGLGLVPELQPKAAVTAHPAAIVLAMLLLRVQKAGSVRRVNATVFEPASEHGQKGMDELHQQTVSLLSFQPLPKNIFDAQVAFNLLARYGEQSVPPLATVENRILKHYRHIAATAPVPSLLLLQAPIFHGHAFAIHIELDQVADVEKITAALSGEHVHVTHGADDNPTNVNAAGQSDIQVSIVPDSNQPNSFWLWAASDNLRIAASTAVECAETMAATRPRGVIQ
ncbi:MAG TPA: Asd/ArgC dimerization domain-containing protein [Terriglobales bacterium]|nr:Asd/ArgC dimerization domain-containing protein [Terriglobales bacterium]